jgi:hypothetical protein
MKSTLIAVLTGAVMLASPALADFRAYSPPAFDGGAFECSVVGHTSERDADPVYKINVNVTLNDGGKFVSMGVVHTVRSGRTYDRSEQYRDRASIWQTEGKMEWNWGGKRSSNVMVGSLYHSEHDGWMYSEQIFQNNTRVYQLLSDCHEAV